MMFVVYFFIYLLIGILFIVIMDRLDGVAPAKSDDDIMIGYVLFWPFWFFIALLYGFDLLIKWIVRKVNHYD